MASIFDIAGSAMNAQMLRLNTTASNMANVDTVSGSEATAYRARQTVFETVMSQAAGGPVAVPQIVESQAPVMKRYEPGHPMADGDG
ncbi:UNVERIFIED_CONTAM: flgC [Trichonephila clavipes]